MSVRLGWTGLLLALSDVFGWVYFLAWSLSFYPQPLLNWKRRSTTGLTVDFPLLNVLGFSCYTFYTTALCFSTSIRSQYVARHPISPQSTVRINDFAFALHALLICMVTYSQLIPGLWKFKDVEVRRASRISQGIFTGSLLGIFVIVVVVLASSHQSPPSPRAWAGLDVVYAASWVKLIVTIAKYIPQAVFNYKAKSTEGWSIYQVLLDALGGVLSISQQVLDSLMEDDWSGITGNPVKFGLGNVSLIFDIIFITQHYVLYTEARKARGRSAAEEEPLLNDDV